MLVENTKVTEILQFYLQNMELEDKIMEALLEEDTEDQVAMPKLAPVLTKTPDPQVDTEDTEQLSS